MEQVFTILYEDSTPARKKISFYNALAANAGLPVQWLVKSASTNGYEQLQSGDADAMLISGLEDFNELREKELTVLVSKRHERRLVALFSPSIEPVYFSKQYTPTYPLTIAADFEWQGQMVANFLAAALPVRTIPYTFLAIGDDHRFDERLTALFDGRVDIAILSLHDLNQAGNPSTMKLKHMVLPLFECPPNIFQATTGLIVKNGKSLLADAVRLSGDVESIEDYLVEASLLNQNVPASYGIFRMNLHLAPFTYLARSHYKQAKETGYNQAKETDHNQAQETEYNQTQKTDYNRTKETGYNQAKETDHNQAQETDYKLTQETDYNQTQKTDYNQTNEIWQMDAALPVGKKLLSTTDYMKDFFRYRYLNDEKLPAKPVCFIASHKSVHNERLIVHLAGRRVWAAGTKTWFELAKKGVWVEGSADGLGLETLNKAWTGVFMGIDKDSVNILTNTDSANQWLTDGWSATGTYELIPSLPPEIVKEMKAAELVFWTSFQQYQACREFVNPGILHAAPAGKTAVLLKKSGIENLVVFPSIKAFNWYRERVYPK